MQVLGMKNTIYATKYSLHVISNRLETAEEWITELVNKSTEIIHTETPNNTALNF